MAFGRSKSARIEKSPSYRSSARKDGILNLVEDWEIPEWKKTDESEICKICAKPWKKDSHRHNCRLCGELICSHCSYKFIIPDKFEKKKNKKGPARVCEHCEAKALKLDAEKKSLKYNSLSRSLSNSASFQDPVSEIRPENDTASPTAIRSIVGLTGDIEVPTWVNIDSSKECKVCSKAFVTTSKHRDKHHCGLCGYLYCSNCTVKRLIGEKFNIKKKSGPIRVCKPCEAACIQKGEEIERKRREKTEEDRLQERKKSHSLLWTKLGIDIKGVREVPHLDREKYLPAKFVLDSFTNLQRREEFSNKPKQQETMLVFSDASLPKSLTVDPGDKTKKLNTKALQLFKVLQLFMGDFNEEQVRGSSGSTNPKTILFELLTSGVRDHTGFIIDEIYVQIMKQTIQNPRLVSLKLGWEALALCSEVLCPSEELRPYLMHYLVMSEDVNPQFREMIHYALRNLEEYRFSETFQQQPIPQFVTEFYDRLRKHRLVQVNFPDGSDILFEITVAPPDGPINASTLLNHIFDLIGLKETEGVGIFEVIGDRERELKPSEIITDLNGTSTKDASVVLVVKQSMYYTNAIPNDPVAVNMIYHQAAVDVCEGNYAVSREELIRFLASHKILMSRVKEIFPKSIGQTNKKRMQTVRVLTYRQSEFWSEIQKKKFIKAVMQMEEKIKKSGILPTIKGQMQVVTKNFTYGAHFYKVKNVIYGSLPSTLIMAINVRGLFLLEPKSKRILKHFPYGHLVGWAWSINKFCFRAVIRAEENHLLQIEFISDLGEEICSVLQAYHDVLLKNPRDRSLSIDSHTYHNNNSNNNHHLNNNSPDPDESNFILPPPPIPSQSPTSTQPIFRPGPPPIPSTYKVSPHSSPPQSSSNHPIPPPIIPPSPLGYIIPPSPPMVPSSRSPIPPSPIQHRYHPHRRGGDDDGDFSDDENTTSPLTKKLLLLRHHHSLPSDQPPTPQSPPSPTSSSTTPSHSPLGYNHYSNHHLPDKLSIDSNDSFSLSDRNNSRGNRNSNNTSPLESYRQLASLSEEGEEPLPPPDYQELSYSPDSPSYVPTSSRLHRPKDSIDSTNDLDSLGGGLPSSPTFNSRFSPLNSSTKISSNTRSPNRPILPPLRPTKHTSSSHHLSPSTIETASFGRSPPPSPPPPPSADDDASPPPFGEPGPPPGPPPSEPPPA